MRQFLQEMGLNLKEPTLVLEDNKDCIEIDKNPGDHKGTRQMCTKLFFVRDEINKTIMLEHIDTKANVADIFTKSLRAERFVKLRNELGLKMIVNDNRLFLVSGEPGSGH